MILTLLLLTLVFAIDVCTPSGIATGVLYVLPVIATWRVRRGRWTACFAIGTVLLTGLGYWFSPDRGDTELWTGLVNRSMALVAVGATTIAGCRWIGSEGKLRTTNLSLEGELKHAQTLQKILYPQRQPDYAHLDVCGMVFPSHELCGDYFAYVDSETGRAGFAVGDVSGSGAGPALVMCIVRTLIRCWAKVEPDPGKLLTGVNRELNPDLPDNMFVTLFLARFVEDGSELEYAAAGHNAYHVQPDGTVTDLEATGYPLGVDADIPYPTRRCPDFDDGHVLVIVTDGITERKNRALNLFGTARTMQVIREHRAAPADEIAERLLAAVADFAKGTPQTDDITVVVVKKRASVDQDASGRPSSAPVEDAPCDPVDDEPTGGLLQRVLQHPWLRPAWKAAESAARHRDVGA